MCSTKFLVAAFLTGCLACNNSQDANNKANETNSPMDNTNRKIEDNKNLIRLWIEEGWNKNRNKELAAQVFSKDWVAASPLPGQPKGIEGAMYWVEEYRKVFSDCHFEITHIVADTSFVTYRYDVSSTYVGTFLGIEPTKIFRNCDPQD